MKRTFTILTAALLLLTMIHLPGNAVGQSSTATFDATKDITTNTQSYATTELTINADDGTTWKANGYGATAYTNIIIGKGGANYLETPEVNGNITSVAVTWSGNENYYLALRTTGGTELSYYQNSSSSQTKTFTVSDSYSQLRLVGRRSSGDNNAAATITKVVVTYTPSGGGGGSTPTITINKNSLTGFSYNVGGGPSAAQTVSVSGSNLGDTDITLEMNDGENSAFEMSLSENSGYNTSLTLPQSSGTVNSTTVYVRLKADKAIANYEDEINLTSSTASKTVSLAGSVLPASVSWDLTTAQFSSQSTDLVTWTSSYASMTNAKNGSNSNANAYLGGTGSYTETHFYTNQKLTISPASIYAISKIEITATTPSQATGIKNATWSNATASASASVVTVTPVNGDLDVTAVFGGNVYVAGVVVYYVESSATFYNITIDDPMFNGNIVADRNEAIQGRTITLSIYPDAGYYLDESNIVVDASGVDVTKVNAAIYTFTMPASNVTVSAEFSVYDGTYYTLVNSTEDLIPGCHYIIANSKTNGVAYAMAAQNGNYRNQVSTIVAGTMVYGTDGIAEIVLSGDATTHWTINDGTTPGGYLYAGGSSNYLKTLSSNGYNASAEWAITITDGEASIVSYVGDNNSNTIRHNAGSSRFSCYTPENTQAPVYLFMKANETACKLYSPTSIAKEVNCATCDLSHTNAALTIANNGILNCSGAITGATTTNLIIADGGQLITSNAVAATVQKDVEAYSSATGAGNTDGWYFIALPINSNSFAPTTAMLTGTYDLYRLNPATTMWENYKSQEDNGSHYQFNLENGRGYLYANNSSELTIDFAGVVKAAAATESVTIPEGWNLIGNPFTYNVYVDRSYYKMNDDKKGVEIVEAYTTNTIAPCTGVVVKATATEETVTFSQNAPNSVGANQGNIQMSVAQQVTNRGTATIEDNAIVSFNEGSNLAKFYFGRQNANLYIPQGNEEYAIVNAQAQGEMPVSFRANENGQYTLTVNAEGVEMNYLHLIDNMTGADIDLLQTPSYTFNATTSDYTSRFKLVFAANEEDGPSTSSGTFAFYNGSEWVISNMGEATLQVVDMMGRVLSTETVSGNATMNTNSLSAGIYMMRLINGNDVKVQKIVVR